ncbi:hypothetical protein FRC00_012701 [Tulasnella sp. 408]|nr:hypothetical protein FRC00_012701 [Tulasnella sp. 408]
MANPSSTPGSPRRRVPPSHDTPPSDGGVMTPHSPAFPFQTPPASGSGRRSSLFLNSLVDQFSATSVSDQAGARPPDEEMGLGLILTGEEMLECFPYDPPDSLLDNAFLDRFSLVLFRPWNVFLCTQCMYCLSTPEVPGHRKSTHSDTILSKQPHRGQLDEFCKQHNVTATAVEILAQHPLQPVPAYPYLEIHKGFACPLDGCRKMGVQKSKIDAHIRETHQVEIQAEPSYFQTLFSKSVGGYVRVLPTELTERPATRPFMAAWYQEYSAKRGLFDPPLVQENDDQSMHPFLQMTGWGKMLTGKGAGYMKRVHAMMEPAKVLHDAMVLWVQRLKALCTTMTYEPRCLLNTDGSTTGVVRKAHGDLIVQSTYDRYTLTWTRFLAFILSAVDLPANEQIVYLTDPQIDSARLLKEGMRTGDAESLIPDIIALSYDIITGTFPTSKTLPPALMAFCVYSNARENGIIADPRNVSPWMAGVQYMIRSFVLYHAAALTAQAEDQAKPGELVLTLYDAVEAEMKWVTEMRGTAFSWVRRIIHAAAQLAGSGNYMPKFMWCDWTTGMFRYGGHSITVAHISALLADSIEEAQRELEVLFDELGLSAEHYIKQTTFADNLAERNTNYNFTKHPNNRELHYRTEQAKRDVLDRSTFGRTIGGRPKSFYKPIMNVLDTCKSFLKALAVAMYLTGGQPPRGPELLGCLLCNTATRIRNIFVADEDIITVIFANKTSYSGSGDKAVARAYPLKLGLMILTYIIIVKPITLILEDRAGLGDNEVALDRTHLFRINGRQLDTDDLNEVLVRLVAKHVPEFPGGWTISEARQIMIYVGHKLVGEQVTEERVALLDLQAGHHSDIAERWYGKEESRLGGSMTEGRLKAFIQTSKAHQLVLLGVQHEPTSGPWSAVEPLQNSADQMDSQGLTIVKVAESEVGHGPRVGDSQGFTTGKVAGPQMGAEQDAVPGGMVMSSGGSMAIARTGNPFRIVQREYSTMAGALDLSWLNSRLETLASEQAMRALTSRMDQLALAVESRPQLSILSPLPSVQPYLLAALRHQLGKKKATFRSLEQAEAIQVVAERRSHLVAVLPTGMGKSEIFLLNAFCERGLGLTTVVMVPLHKLKDQHQKLAEQREILAHYWPNQNFADLHFAIFEVAGVQRFIDKLRELHSCGKLARIVIDECHYLFGASEGFREGMRAMSVLGSIGVPLVLLTGTLPPNRVAEQLALVGISSAKEIRTSTSRRNIHYAFRKVDLGKDCPPASKQHRHEFAKYVIAALEEAFQSVDPPVVTTYDPDVPDSEKTCVLVFFHWTELIDAVHQLKPEWFRCHSQMSKEEREQQLAFWGKVGEVMLGSSLLGLGFHKDNIRGSFHWELPRNMYDFSQESGRVARGGGEGWSIVLWTRKPSKPYMDQFGRSTLIDTCDTNLCRRIPLETFLDGRAATCITQPHPTVFCDNCELAILAVSVDQRPLQPTALGAATFTTEPQPGPSAAGSKPKAMELKDWIQSLNKYCAACFVCGRGKRSHVHTACNETPGAAARNKITTEQAYVAFKRSYEFQPWAKICFRCHLPQTPAWHTRRGYHDDCHYDDIMSATIFHAMDVDDLQVFLTDKFRQSREFLPRDIAEWSAVRKQTGFINETELFEEICNIVLARHNH